MSWTKLETMESGRKIDIFVNFDNGMTIKPTPDGHVTLEPLTKSVKILKHIDSFEYLTLISSGNSRNVNLDVSEDHQVDTTGPKIITKSELEKKLGKSGPVVEKKVEKPKRPTPPRPVSKPGTTSAALDMTPEVVSEQ